MTWFSAAAVKFVGAASMATLLSLGAAGVLAQSVPSGTAASVATKAPATDRSDRRAIARAVFESEADVLGITPETLRDDLKKGQKVSDLAKDKGMIKEQFETKLLANLKPRLAALISAKVITQKQADKVLDRIAKGHIPFWNGTHHHKKK
ncbi:MAG TPA: hypothetical protein VIO37_07030 [Candidatus Dormibacteraeota bacterium]|jgi:hypothetical protein